MERRQFLSMTLGAVALAAVPASVRAEDFRKSKPTVWTTKNVMDGKKVTYQSALWFRYSNYGRRKTQGS